MSWSSDLECLVGLLEGRAKKMTVCCNCFEDIKAAAAVAVADGVSGSFFWENLGFSDPESALKKTER